jgi:hypothetical protein
MAKSTAATASLSNSPHPLFHLAVVCALSQLVAPRSTVTAHAYGHHHGRVTLATIATLPIGQFITTKAILLNST